MNEQNIVDTLILLGFEKVGVSSDFGTTSFEKVRYQLIVSEDEHYIYSEYTYGVDPSMVREYHLHLYDRQSNRHLNTVIFSHDVNTFIKNLHKIFNSQLREIKLNQLL